MGKTRALAVAAFVAAFVGVGATSALAGEITGNGKPLWTNTDQWKADHELHGNSICAFSGQEDDQYGAVSATDPLNVKPALQRRGLGFAVMGPGRPGHPA